MQAELPARFRDRFGRESEFRIFAPGRINLIGEHIDYCGGLVLPMAIDRGTSCAGAVAGGGKVRIHSTRFDETAEFDLLNLPARRTGHWSDYAIGVAWLLGGAELPGMDLLVEDNIGAGGLSSSASFSVAVALALLKGAGREIGIDQIDRRLELARQCREAENEYVGIACGIMDQASVVLGGILRLDCASLEFERIKADFGDHAMVIMDTRKERVLAASRYNQRVDEVGQILAALRPEFGIDNLCALPVTELEKAMAMIDDGTLKKRLRHVVTEQDRVVTASRALSDGDLQTFGALMDASHASLRDDYEVTGRELDAIVEASRRQAGVVGARMTGAGFGGCAIALVAGDCLALHERIVAEAYRQRTGLTARFLTVAPAKGAQVL